VGQRVQASERRGGWWALEDCGKSHCPGELTSFLGSTGHDEPHLKPFCNVFIQVRLRNTSWRIGIAGRKLSSAVRVTEQEQTLRPGVAALGVLVPSSYS
jgi:hypothetical protein